MLSAFGLPHRELNLTEMAAERTESARVLIGVRSDLGVPPRLNVGLYWVVLPEPCSQLTHELLA